jgi:hypothetical protein
VQHARDVRPDAAAIDVEALAQATDCLTPSDLRRIAAALAGQHWPRPSRRGAVPHLERVFANPDIGRRRLHDVLEAAAGA